MSSITLKKIVNIALALIITDMLLDKALYFLDFRFYPSFRRLRHISRKLVGYR